MIKIGLIRHAMTPWNFEKRIQGREDIGLNSEGMRQAQSFARILSFEKFDLILSSTMARAKQTAQIISSKINVDIEYDNDLREQDFGDWEGKKIRNIRKFNPGMVEFQETRGWEFCPPGGESSINVLKRSFKALKKAGKRHDKKYILAVTHNSVIKTLIYKTLNRKFIPEKTPFIKDYYLHILAFDRTLEIKKLNSSNLRKLA